MPDLVEAIAGERVRGSWWSHPSGKAIFAVANRLEDAADVVTAKVIGGKVTFVHARLWPALLRVVTDRQWRRTRSATLDADAKALLTRVERAKRLDAGARELAPARKALEASLLVRSMQEHTEAGRHTTVLESWRAWASAETARAATALSIDDAHAFLRAHRIDLT